MVGAMGGAGEMKVALEVLVLGDFGLPRGLPCDADADAAMAARAGAEIDDESGCFLRPATPE